MASYAFAHSTRMASSLLAHVEGLFASTEPFTLLTDDQRSAMQSKLAIEFYKSGEVILQQGNDLHRALYIVAEGLVRQVEVETGRTIEMTGEGSHFGSYGLIQGGVLPYEARAVEDTACALIAAETFRALLKENADFKAYFEEDIKRYVRSLDDDIDASGAFLLFDITLGKILRSDPPVAHRDTTVREAAQRMYETESDSIVIVREDVPIGLFTEGDIVRRIASGEEDLDAPVMQLVNRPPIALGTHERLFDAVRAMMKYRIRRVIVVDPKTGALRGLLTSEDISQYRGLDPVATTERIERGRSIDELATLRSDSNRRLYRLYHQGVHSEDLLDVVSEVDDQLKQRVLQLVERDVREEAGESAPPEGQWAWLAFGAAGRQESVLRGWQDNGLVYADPAPGTEASTAAFYETLATRAVEAFRACGYAEPENNVSATHASFRQPVSAWTAAYRTWTEGAEAEATSRAALCFDVRAIYGDESLVDLIHQAIRKQLPNPRLSAILARRGTTVELPLSTFGRFEVDEVDGITGIDVFHRVLLPVVHLARSMALDLGELASSNTFDRLRAVAESDHVLSSQASELLPAYKTLLGLRLRSQMQAAEVGGPVTDQLDPETLNKSQQNLLKEALRSVQDVQTGVRKHFGL
ncbi:MAG: DUF294 nucleotidyltransferase-like domain-containing protein [Rubricoccaceae bacterium]